MSVEQGYSALLGRDCTLEEYFVYAKLTKLGYKASSVTSIYLGSFANYKNFPIQECKF